MAENKEQKTEEKKADWRDDVLPRIKSGMTIKVHQKIREKNTKGEEKERIQIFEGLVLGRKGGMGKSATITVRKIAVGGIGVERVFPIFSPNIAKIELLKQARVRQAKIGFTRTYKKKLKEKKIV